MISSGSWAHSMRLPDGDHDRAGQLTRAWANFDAQLTDHHESEHEIVWPALGARAPRWFA